MWTRPRPRRKAHRMDHDRDIDALGLLCPLPVLRARKALAEMPPGAVLRLRASDAMSWIDVPHFCAAAGHVLLSASDAEGIKTYLIRKAG